MFVNTMPALRDPQRGRDGGRSTAAGGGSSPRSGSSSCSTRRSRRSAPRARRSRARTVDPRPRVRARAGGQGAARVRRAGAQPGADDPRRRRQHMAFASVYGCPFVREGDVRREATMDDFENLVQLSQAFPRARLAGRHDLRAQRHAAGLAPPRHGLRAADPVGQAVHGLGDVGPERRRHDRDGRDPLRRARGDRGDAGVDLADQRQLAAALRRPHAQRADRVRDAPTRR